jgi:DNA polymerase III epsilon subunit-like protein
MKLFFDTETTGLPKKYYASIEELDNWPRIVQIAWLKYDNLGNFISEKEHIIKPDGFEIPDSSSRIHGITTKKALDLGVDLKPVLKEFSSEINNADTIIAHNMSFDEKIVLSEFYRNNIENNLSNITKICTMQSSTNYCKIPGKYGKYKWPNLIELHNILFNCNFKSAHNALADVRACAKCYFELKRLGKIH